MASTPTNGDDVIFGTDADNTINSLGGNDLVFGGLGDDILQGSTGNDQLSGGLGVDILVGGSGSDTAFYGLALDDVRANLNLGFGFLTNLGQAADGDQFFSIENLTGGFGNDVLIGNSAANVINGNSGNDQINGGAGRDTINAGLGNDFVAGNEDGDVYVFAHGKEKRLLRKLELDQPVKSVPVAVHGVLYLVTETNLFAIGNQ